MKQQVEKEVREHHEWGWHFIWLWIKVMFLRIMTHIDVYTTDHLRPQIGNDVRIEKIKFPSRDPGRYIKAHVYTPVDLPEGPNPIHINVHGSGFTVHAFFGNSRWFCYQVASKLKCVVIDTDYRKAPEYPYPFPSRDVEDSILWVLSQPQRFDKETLTVSGFSAGGNLALAAANRLDDGIVKAAVLYYPPTDATTEEAAVGRREHPDPKESARSGTHLDSWMFATFFQSYLPPHVSPGLPQVSVLYLPLERYPHRMLFVAGRCDVLHDNSGDFYDRVQKEGRPEQKAHTRFISVPFEDHAFDEVPKTPESVEWRDKVYQAGVDTIRAAHEEARQKRALSQKLI
ncbi:hypothetical protein MYAM1_002428 [Malassezia yamatoensis]|uniref:Alpha/beta hydrolase fold-3 domain-containing protein n=1 Tax=Malassezia yamatoensis TaxID=253288 RepID=A0AAJ5YUS4_9BASI|nr:hypothetical protein MYAM1_002428 [Malassezia yamatoensis]